jgi:pyruvate,water dikinase
MSEPQKQEDQNSLKTIEIFSVIGKKGIFLQDMITAKVLVPPAFVISGIVDRFMQETRLYAKIEAVMEVIIPNLENIDSIVRASKEIISLINKTDFTEELKKDIYKEFDKLKTEYVSVRHSFTISDELSFYLKNEFRPALNINKEKLLSVIKASWAVNYSPSAMMYRLEKKLAIDEMFSVLVIQKMIDAQVSGVCYTQHPIIKINDQLFIEAVFGFSGLEKKYASDTYIVSKKDWKILGKTLNAQKNMLTRVGGGSVEIVVGEVEQHKPKLTDEQITSLSKLSCHIENFYKNQPQRIEWVFSENKFYVLDADSVV